MVITHHNRGEFLLQALESVRKQDYRRTRIEIVIVDDGSSDPAALETLTDIESKRDELCGRSRCKVVRIANSYLGRARFVSLRMNWWMVG